MSKEIDVNKTNSSHDFIICHEWYFLDTMVLLSVFWKNVHINNINVLYYDN